MAITEGGAVSQMSAKPRRVARYSVAAILVALVGLVSICMWMVLMALEWGGRSKPTVLYLPPWVLPVIFGVLAFVLLALHWREIAAAEADRRLSERRRIEPAFQLVDPHELAAGKLELVRSGFSNVLTARHKVHTIASHVLTFAMAGLLIFVTLLLLRTWLKQ